MRIIVHGLGAVGGTLAAALSSAGQEVIGIARGAQLDAIAADGLTLRTPDGARTVCFPCAASPRGIALRDDDAIVLAVKSQDSAEALADLRAAGLRDQPLFLAQNGVENERLAARLFPSVHGICVMLPAEYLRPGTVTAFGAPKLGILDIGRYPSGTDAADEALAAALESAGFAAFPIPDVMQSKYGKLLMNLGNIVEAAFGKVPGAEQITARARSEGEAVLAAAGIAWRDVGASDPRRDAMMKVIDLPGRPRAGSSTSQSLARGTGTIETDYLNGEIVLLGRLHGVPTPTNSWLAGLAARMARQDAAPGSVPVSAYLDAVGA